MPILAWKGEEVVRLERLADENEVGADYMAAALEDQLVELPDAETVPGLTPFFGVGAVVESLELEGEEAQVVVWLPGIVWEKESAEARDRFSWILEEWAAQSGAAVQAISVRVIGSGGVEILRLENEPAPLLSKPQVPMVEETFSPMGVPHAPAQGTAQPNGGLSDASIFLGPSHGWYYSSNLGRWATQRFDTSNYQIVEDLNSGESVLQYLHQYLWNAGARTYTTRERDLNTNMVIVTQGGAGYSQTGSWVTESNVEAYDGKHRYTATVTGAPTATARFTPNIPEAGYYAVYVWYQPVLSGSTTVDARITTHHTGDSTLWVQNQNRDGNTWKYIGSYYFENGVNPETGSVVIDNKSSVGGRRVVAGAVRFGGGMGDVKDETSGTVSGKPRWEESGRYYAGFMGKTDWANFGTVNAMPRWVAWEHEPWEQGKSVYLSWHTNAAGGTGTETFSHVDPVAKSNELRDLVQDQVIRDIRAAWKPTWVDRGGKVRDLGELNKINNPKTPAALIEMAFHDREEDVRYLLDPQFRRDSARAIYKGLVQFYVQHLPEFNNATYLPEPPRNFRVSAQADGSVQLAWIAPEFSSGTTGLYGHAATGYRVYRSKNGYGFDNGTAVSGTSSTLSGFVPGELVFLRVAATNAGGESFPTSTLAVRIPGENSKKVLLVNGFTRNDRFMNLLEDDTQVPGQVQRGYVGNLNTYNYSVPHAQAIAAYPELVGIESAESVTVEDGSVSLADYDAVIWMAGLQAQVNDIGSEQMPAFSDLMRIRIAQYTNQGGQLFVSGAQVGSDLDRAGESSWLRGVLKANYIERSSVSGVSGLPESILSGWSGSFGMDGAGYALNKSDVIEPFGGSVSSALYSSSTGADLIDGFETTSGWWQPSESGSSRGDGTFSAVANPVFHGNGAAKLTYDWTQGNFLRIHKPSKPQFPADSDFSIWVYGDNSGHRFRLSVSDSDGELFANDYTTIDFTGWREIVWSDVRNNYNRWAGSGDGVVTGPQVNFESLQLQRGSGGPMTGTIYFDYATVTSILPDGPDRMAGIEYESSDQRLFYLAFPFEKIGSEIDRASLMTRVLDFFRLDQGPFEAWQEEFFSENELTDLDISGELANPSGDGIPNVLKYALNLDPQVASRSGLPEVSIAPNGLTLRYNRAKRATDLSYIIEVSDDLVSWENGENEVEVVSTVDEGETELITVRDKKPFPESGRRFIRLRVTRE